MRPACRARADQRAGGELAIEHEDLELRRARAFRLDTPTRGRAAVDVRVLGVASRAGCAGWLGGAERAGFRPQTRKKLFCRMTRRRATKRERGAGSSTTHRETARAAVCVTRFLEGARSARARAVDGARAREGNCHVDGRQQKPPFGVGKGGVRGNRCAHARAPEVCRDARRDGSSGTRVELDRPSTCARRAAAR